MRREGAQGWSPGTWSGMMIYIGFLAGGVLGCLFGACASAQSTQQVGTYLMDYMGLARAGALSWSVWEVLWEQGRWLLGCALLGMTGAGAVALPVLFGMRGFLAAFGVSCFLRTFGYPGILPALVLLGLPALFWAPCLFLAGSASLRHSLHRPRRKAGERLITAEGRRTLLPILLAALFFLLCVVVEWGLLPILLPFSARILE